MLREKSIKALKVNQEISADKILLIDDEGQNQGIVSRDQALYLAYEKGLDLALINEKITPPIGKLLDYGKYLYNQEKQLSKQKARTHTSEIKEVRMGLKIGQHDLQVKIDRIKSFFDRGDKVKVVVILRGREMAFRHKVPELLERVRKEVNGTFEKQAEKMGNRFSVTMMKNNSKENNNETKNS